MAVTEDEALRIDEEWSALRAERALEEDLDSEGIAAADIEAERTALRVKVGGEPQHNDVIWALLLKRRQVHGSARQWGLYRNTTLTLARRLVSQNRHGDAIPLLVDICLFDVWEHERLNLALERDGVVLSTAERERQLAPGIVELLKASVETERIEPEQLAEIINSRWATLPMLAKWPNKVGGAAAILDEFGAVKYTEVAAPK